MHTQNFSALPFLMYSTGVARVDSTRPGVATNTAVADSTHDLGPGSLLIVKKVVYRFWSCVTVWCRFSFALLRVYIYIYMSTLYKHI